MIVQSEIIAILDNVLGQRGRLRKGGSQLLYHCPVCADKNRVTQKLEVSVSGPTIGCYHCWRCNFRGRSFGSLLKNLNASQNSRSAMFKLTGDIKLARDQQTDEYTEVRLPPEFHPMRMPKKTPEYKNALAYLKRRGVTREDILRYNIGFCESGEYEQHIIIPSYDAHGDLNFFTGRKYYEDGTIFRHKKPNAPMNTIIGFECLINWNEPVILVEGAFNAITIRRNAIPLFGKFPSSKLYETMIANHVERVYVCLDTDAVSDAIKICERLLRLGIVPYIVTLSGGKDANEIGFVNSWRCIQSAVEVDSTFLLRYHLEM